jgi:penicillin amidase
LHTVTFAHPASEHPELARLFDLGPFETTGGSGTVRAAGYDTQRPFRVVSGSTYRMVVDLADPARAWATTTGGQSGHPASPHYGDQARLWVEDRYHPLLMDAQDFAPGLEGDLTLHPDPAKSRSGAA